MKNRKLKESIQEYKHLKTLCEAFPQHLEEEKTALLADALSMYEQIKKLKQGGSSERQKGLQEESKQQFG